MLSYANKPSGESKQLGPPGCLVLRRPRASAVLKAAHDCPSSGIRPLRESFSKTLLVTGSSSFVHLCLPPQICDPWQDSGGGWEHQGCWLASPKSWGPDQGQYCSKSHAQRWNCPTCIFITHTQLGPQGRWESQPCLVSLRENHLMTISSFFISSVQPRLGPLPAPPASLP